MRLKQCINPHCRDTFHTRNLALQSSCGRSYMPIKLGGPNEWGTLVKKGGRRGCRVMTWNAKAAGTAVLERPPEKVMATKTAK